MNPGLEGWHGIIHWVYPDEEEEYDTSRGQTSRDARRGTVDKKRPRGNISRNIEIR